MGGATSTLDRRVDRWHDRRSDRRHDPRVDQRSSPGQRQPLLDGGTAAAFLGGAAGAIGNGAALALGWAAWNYYHSRTCLRAYGGDMACMATDPVVGRDREIDAVVDILCRRTKNCAALVGAAGVGKTAIAEGFAQRIAASAVPPALAGARVVELDLAAMVAGTVLRGMFERSFKGMVDRAEASGGKVVLFIDEMHMLAGAWYDVPVNLAPCQCDAVLLASLAPTLAACCRAGACPWWLSPCLCNCNAE